MSKKTKIILGVAGLFLFFGVIGSIGSSNTSVKSTAPSQSAQITISPVKKSSASLIKITVAPTAKPTITPWPTNTPIPTAYIEPTVQYIAPTAYIQPTTPPAQSSTGLSNNNYYQNVDGNEVHSPAYSTNGSAPAGATAQCNDGTYSFSQHHSGTCSGHGGVSQWL